MTVDTNHYEEVKQETIDGLDDRILQMDNLLKAFGAGAIDAEALLSELRINAHSIKSSANLSEMGAIKAISHRFEDYLADVKKPTDSIVSALQVFVDHLSKSLDNLYNGIAEDISVAMRSLPAKGGFDFNVDDITTTDTEVMLVMEPGIATKIVTKELLECGYRMVNVASTMDALMLIPSMRPDLVIVSRVMPELDGVDLACAVRAMPSTRDIPVALLTSEALDSETLRNLPKDVPIMRKGGNFADDVAEVFVKLGLI